MVDNDSNPRDEHAVTHDAEQLSKAFAALADPVRRDIVSRLTDGDATVGQLAQPYPITLQAVSKHLRVLEDAGLVTRSREQQRRPVHLEADVLSMMTGWLERYRRRAEERYTRLDQLLERTSAANTPDPAIAAGPHRARPHEREQSA